MSANLVGNTLTQSEAMETYTTYDVTSSMPRKTTIAFFANFGGIEKLFFLPDPSLYSKILNQCNIEDVHHTKMMFHWIIHYLRTFSTE